MQLIRSTLCGLSLLAAAPSIAGQQTCNGPPSRQSSDFVISSDGLEVRDLKTGLIWSRCMEGSTWTGSVCLSQSAEYANVIPAEQFTYSAALQRAAARSTPQMTWRLPTMHELETIREPGCYNPSANLTLFPVAPDWSSDGSLWSTTQRYKGVFPASGARGPAGGRVAMSAIGTSDSWTNTINDEFHYVRLVRADPAFKRPTRQTDAAEKEKVSGTAKPDPRSD
jgi:hypothetical protein